MESILNQAFEEVKQVRDIIWAPIRHHSPQCSFQLQQLIDSEKPDVILIEGPSEANHLLPYLSAKDVTAPVAVYIYAVNAATDSDSAARENRYRCFLPFAPMSPEWVAIQEAQKRSTEMAFIDLPYQDRMNLSDRKEQHCSGHEALLNDDSLIANADPVKSLLSESQCRDFDEWWDRHFETGTYIDDCHEFFDDMLRFCLLMRDCKFEDIDQRTETLAREAYMASLIDEHRQDGKRCLIVCGGFHCLGISRFLEKPEQRQLALSAVDKESVKSTEHGVHLVPYTIDRLNSAGGYAAGFPDCGYYEKLWGLLQDYDKSRTRAEKAKSPNHFCTALNTSLANELFTMMRANSQFPSIADAIESSVMSERLAALRGYQAGRVELKDSVLSCFLKEARDGSEKHLEHLLNRMLAGDGSGVLPDGLPVVPIVADFREKSKTYQLPLSPMDSKEKNLDIYRSHRHRTISAILHQLQFLQVPYAQVLSGPDFVNGQHLERVREVWQFQWSAETEARLIECSHLGSSLMDASLNKLLTILHNPETRGDEKVALLLTALRTGLHQMLPPIAREINEWIGLETELSYLCKGLNQLSVCYNVSGAIDAKGLDDLQSILQSCFERICTRMPWVKVLDEEACDSVIDAIANMNFLITNDTDWCDESLFFDALKLTLELETNWQIKGISAGVLVNHRKLDVQQTVDIFEQAFSFGDLAPAIAGEFLQGFLRVARSTLVLEEEVLTLVSERVLAWDEDAFLQSLPSLRLAFTQLSPREKRELGIALNEGKPGLYVANLEISQSTLMRAKHLQDQAMPILNRWGLL